MSITTTVSNLQRAREALGTHLRELRRASGLNGKQFAAQLGWPPSKISKIEGGQQTPSKGDLTAWAAAAGTPGVAEQLLAELTALESFYSEWRRQLRAGMRFRQQQAIDYESKTKTFRVFEPLCVPGLLQTAEYARRMLASGARLHGAPDDVDDAVVARMQRQDVVYRPGKQFFFLLPESAVRSCAVAPLEVMLSQVDRLVAATIDRADTAPTAGAAPYASLIRVLVAGAARREGPRTRHGT